MINELIVFDLDGTLLNHKAELSNFTQATLQKLRQRNIAYTVATGRTIHSGRDLIAGHHFTLPHIYNNGVVIWDPQQDTLSLDNSLSYEEITLLIDSANQQDLTPFISVVNSNKNHTIYTTTIRNQVEQRIVEHYQTRTDVKLEDIGKLPTDATITNVNFLGATEKIAAIQTIIDTQEHLIAYSGEALEGNGTTWMDIHHSQATKGGALQQLKQQLGIQKIICFGDNHNDHSMFSIADESYAMANATDNIKAIATATIGHHQENGVAHYLTERFGL